MSTDFIIRPAAHGDIDQILGLLSVCMPNSPIPRERAFWEWKHIRNPFGISPALLAFSGEKLIGLRIFMRWAWWSDDLELPSARAVDTVTDPLWRGKRVFSTLTSQLLDQMRSEGICFVFNTPNRFSLPGYLRMGWKRVTRVPLLIRSVNPLQGLLRLMKIQKNVVSDESHSSSTVGDMLRTPDIIKVLPTVLRDARLHTKRTYEYLMWRYVEIPFFSYQAKSRFNQGGSALLIYRKRIRKGLQELSICEFVLSPNAVGIQLGVELVEEILKNEKCDYMVATAATNTPEFTALQSLKFHPAARLGPVFTVRELNQISSAPSPLQWKSWRCSLGDLEIF